MAVVSQPLDETNPLSAVPKIDYADLVSGAALEQIRHAVKEYAFFYIINIPEFDASLELNLMKGYFAQSYAEKDQCASVKNNPDNCNVLRGYGYQNSGGTRIEEVFNIGQYETADSKERSCKAEKIAREPNVWPDSTPSFDGARFKEIMKKGFDIRMRVSKMIVDALGRIIDSEAFPRMFGESEFTSFYLKKYTERNAEDNIGIYAEDSGYTMVAEDGRDLSIPSHVDTTVTLLTTYNNGGLQAMYKGEWHDVPSLLGSIMMMSGSLMHELTEGQLPPLKHRVIDIKRDRFSLPFFLNPSFHSDISKTWTSGKETETGKSFKTFGPWQVTQLHRDEPLLLCSTSLF
uniref:Putative isopenicillin-n-synthase n=1 Tax=Hormiphora californensis TaxID=1403702 RepID=A0A0A0RVV4_HORCA|nr:putative isopenicillin-n-synthase [Hormiphora californensis]